MGFGTVPDHLGAWLAALARLRRSCRHRQLPPVSELPGGRPGAHPVGLLETYVDGFRVPGEAFTEDGLTLVPVREVALYLGWAMVERGDTWVALDRVGGYVRLPLNVVGEMEYAALGDLSQLDACLRFRRHPHVNRLELITAPVRAFQEWS